MKKYLSLTNLKYRYSRKIKGIYKFHSLMNVITSKFLISCSFDYTKKYIDI